MGARATKRQPGLVGVGYEGYDIDTFVADLVRDGVTHLVDVRLNPISHKPGFSKSRLAQALAASGIGYEHRRELGNPKPNRAGFTGTPEEMAAARATYVALLSSPAADEAIQGLADRATHERVAVLCVEADQHRCHRELVLAEVARRASAGSGGRRRGR